MIVPLTSVYTAANDLIYGVGTALVTYVGSYAAWWLSSHAKFLDAQTQAHLTAGLETALQNGITYGMSQADKVELTHDKLTVENPVVAIAADYVIDHMGDTLKKLNISSSSVSALILARLPKVPPAQ